MLKYRVIPTLLWKGVGLVKGERFDSWRRVGSVLPAVRVYNARDVDELILVDISASAEDRGIDLAALEQIADSIFVPLTVGGGIRTVEQVKQVLRAGADKIALNTAAYTTPNLVREIADAFGTQCVVASVDVRVSEDGYRCWSVAGTRDEERDPVAWAVELERLGAGEILLTSIDKDGTMSGYDLDLVAAVSEAVNIPVIASGGAATPDDFAPAIRAGAAAVAAASMFHFTQATPQEGREAIAAAGYPVRITH